MGLVFAAMYWGAAALAWREPVILSPGRVDAAIPVLPWAIWIYLSEYLLVLAAIVLPTRAPRSVATVSMSLACVLGGFAYLGYPTTIPRLTPLPQGLTGYAWQWLYVVDTPNNSLPSMHAALATIAAAALWSCGPAWRIAGFAWAFAVLVSALAIRQHFLADLLAGIGVGLVAQVLMHRHAGSRNARKTAQRTSSP